jgi:uncharacterized protein
MRNTHVTQDIRLRIAGGVTIAAAVIGLSVITSTIVASQAYERRGRQVSEQSSQIVVRGSARQRITSDLAVWTVRVRGQGPTLPEAFATLDKGSGRVRAFLSAENFAPGDIEVSAIDTDTIFKRTDNGNLTTTIDSYAMTRVFTVTSKDCPKVLATAGKVTELLKEGIEVYTSSPNFYYSKLADLRITILGDASADARSRGEEIATRAKARITELKSISAGPIQLTPPNSTDVSSGGSYDTSTIEKDASVSVSATFGLSGR